MDVFTRWSPDAVFVAADLVAYNGDLYEALDTSTGVAPPGDGTKWRRWRRSTAAGTPGSILPVFGTPSASKIPKWNASTQRLEWADDNGGSGASALYRQVIWSVTYADLNSALATDGHVVATLAPGEYLIESLSFVAVPVAFNGSNPGLNLIDFDLATGTAFVTMALDLADTPAELVLVQINKDPPFGGVVHLLNPVDGDPCPIVAQVLDTTSSGPYVTPGSTAGALTVLLTIGSLV